MKIYFKDEERTNSLPFRLIIYAIIALLLSVFHIVFLNFIAVADITPDFLLILCVWISLAEGQMIGACSGFSIGLLLDVISLDVIGTNALAKTVAGFVAGWFYKKGSENYVLGSLQFLAILALCTVIHNLIYYFFYIKFSDLAFFPFFLRYGIASTVYTTVFGVFGMLLKARRR